MMLLSTLGHGVHSSGLPAQLEQQTLRIAHKFTIFQKLFDKKLHTYKHIASSLQIFS